MSRGLRARAIYSPAQDHDPEAKLFSSGEEDGEDETLFQMDPSQRSGSSDVHSRSREMGRGDGDQAQRDMVDLSKETKPETYTLEEAVEAIGMGWFQIKMYLICGVVGVSCARFSVLMSCDDLISIPKAKFAM
ncbi:hypothetical protein EGW08_014156 [Elysia chlorotica]|uniref:Uncharacterized protein n=1 Tax=Elysia chlorotica TaxID=188477 RepID=A0A433T959_ELYCH|nr:hypothetical protein EGW08_014156 [Elysia chlorotica]